MTQFKAKRGATNRVIGMLPFLRGFFFGFYFFSFSYYLLSGRKRRQLRLLRGEQDSWEPMKELKENGMAKWKALASPKEVLALKDIVRSYTLAAEKYFLSQPLESRRSYVKEFNCEFTRNNAWHEDDGRYRALFTEKFGFPDFIHNFIAEKKLYDFATHYFGTWCYLTACLLERYEYAANVQHDWHVDTIGDELKVMVLLADTPIESGPLRYQKFSHLPDSILNPFYYLIFKYGQLYQGLILTQMAARPVYGTGSAGDAIVFDTAGMHSTTQIISGERYCLVFKFRAKSAKNLFVRFLGAGF